MENARSYGAQAAAMATNLENRIIQLRREFHAHPELSHQEEWTRGRIREELSRMGIPCDCVGSSGIAGRLDCGGGPAVALRADIDALPITEETGAPYQSEHDGKMHACGHDAHAAMLLGAAEILADMKDSLHGTVYLCFQGAEEINEGAEEFVEYLEARGGVKLAAGLHIWSPIPEGRIYIPDGPAMAGVFFFTADVRGRGGHASRPDLSDDPIKAACDLVLKLSAIPAIFSDPRETCVVHIGQILAGTRGNIFPDTAQIKGGARFFSRASGEGMMERIRAIANGAESQWNVKVDITATDLLPPVVNDAACAERARKIVSRIPGLSVDETLKPILASDNVSLFLEKYPGIYGLIGGGNHGLGCSYEHHNARFNIDESALAKGAAFLAGVAADALTDILD